MNNTPVFFDSVMIAPCGINCGTCYAFLRANNKCPGCRVYSAHKTKTRQSCLIKTCSHLTETKSGFCYDCGNLPCKRLNQLDKRYRLKYHTSLVQNLLTIKEVGMDKFLVDEVVKWTCPGCGSTLSIHSDQCLVCHYIIPLA
jgi:hypothetical protein